MLLELRGDVLGERIARVVHRAQQTFDLEPRIQMRTNFANGLHEIRQTLERIVFALHGNQHRIGGAQSVQRKQ